jgi:hypothetical protein
MNQILVIEVELLQISCPRCDYKADMLSGTQDSGQTFSDLNEDFAYYKLFLCPKGNDIQSIDISFREFNGSCPQHRVDLRPMASLPQTCPKCGGPVQVTRREIIKTTERRMTE